MAFLFSGNCYQKNSRGGGPGICIITTFGVNQMLEHSTTQQTQDIVTLIAAHVSHEKKSSEGIAELLQMMKYRVESHTELLSGLLSMSQHGFQLDSFAHVLEELYSQSEEITQCLSLLTIPASSDEAH